MKVCVSFISLRGVKGQRRKESPVRQELETSVPSGPGSRRLDAACRGRCNRSRRYLERGTFPWICATGVAYPTPAKLARMCRRRPQGVADISRPVRANGPCCMSPKVEGSISACYAPDGHGRDLLPGRIIPYRPILLRPAQDRRMLMGPIKSIRISSD